MRIKRSRFSEDASVKPTESFTEGAIRIRLFENETWRKKALKWDISYVVPQDGYEQHRQGIPVRLGLDAFLVMQKFEGWAVQLGRHHQERKPTLGERAPNPYDPYDINRKGPFLTFCHGECRIRVWHNRVWLEEGTFDVIHVAKKGNNEIYSRGIPLVFASDAFQCMHKFAAWAAGRNWRLNSRR